MISLSVIQLVEKTLEPYGERVQHVSTSLLILEGETWAVFRDQNTFIVLAFLIWGSKKPSSNYPNTLAIRIAMS